MAEIISRSDEIIERLKEEGKVEIIQITGEEMDEFMENWTVNKKDKIEKILIDLWDSIYMTIPDNYEDIVQYVYEDVCEKVNPDIWDVTDVGVGFRRWVESNKK